MLLISLAVNLILLGIIAYLLKVDAKKEESINYFAQAALDFQDELNDYKKEK